ncbi:MAG: hypothetical protein AB1644_01730 [Candidatus Zixiibacteriota bacterium]
MTETRRKQVVYSALVLAMIYGLWNFTVGRKAEIAPEADEPVTRTDSLIPKPARPIDVSDIMARPWGRDPFSGETARLRLPIKAQTPDRFYWILSGIIYSDKRPMAVINYTPVAVGDIVGGARVVKIEKSKVTLEQNGNRFDIFVTKG